jgi:hypothetical protein
MCCFVQNLEGSTRRRLKKHALSFVQTWKRQQAKTLVSRSSTRHDMPKRNPLYEPHTFKKGPRKPNTMAAYKPPSNNAITSYPGHVTEPEVVKSRALVAQEKRRALDLCAGYDMLFGLPRDRVMGSAENAAFVHKMSDNPESRLRAEKYALAARQLPPKEQDFKRPDTRQVIDQSTNRALIESVLSGEASVPKRTKGLRIFEQAYLNTEVRAEDIPRAARHEMESMPASYKVNLTRTLCQLYPKYSAQSRLVRQRMAHSTSAELQSTAGMTIGGRQAVSHAASVKGIADRAVRAATAEVTSRPNNVRIVSLMRTAAPSAP